MRDVINISLPMEMSRVVKKAVKSGQYGSKSEFFRNLLRMWMEGSLLKKINESRQELMAGQGKVLRSLKDLR